MQRIFTRLLNPARKSPMTAIEALQQKTLNALAWGVGICCLLLRIFLLIMGDPVLGEPGRGILYIAIPLFLIGLILILFMQRYVAYWVTSLIFILFLILMTFLSDTPPQVLIGETAIFFIIPIAIAGLLLRPWAGYAVAGMIIVVNIVLVIHLRLGIPNIVNFILFFLIALIIQLATSRLQRAMELEQKKSLALTESEKAISLQNQRIQEISQKLLEVQELEKRHLAAELHDDLGQSLTSLKLLMELASKESSAANRQKEMAGARELVTELMAKVRNLSLDLRPAMLDDFGLFPALRWLFDRFQSSTGIYIQCDFEVECKDRFDPRVETAAFRIIQEALTNVVRHASVQEAKVSISMGSILSIEVSDDGKGFNIAPIHSDGFTSAGLSGMQERARLVGGSVEIISKPEFGHSSDRPDSPGWKRPMKKIKIILADDHAVVRQGVRALLDQEKDMEVVGEAADGLHLLDLTEKLRPDVVVVDLKMPCLNGIEAAREIQKRFSNVHVVILTMHADRSYIDTALEAGVCGYVLKEEDIGEMYVAIRYAARGSRYLSAAVSQRVPAVEKSNAVSNPILLLTGRERQVFQLIAEGKTNNEAAQILGISIRTVEVHRAHMMKKFNLKTHIDFVRFALQYGIL